MDLLEAVYGEVEFDRAVDVWRIDAGMLTLDDLAIAVRPGRPIETSIEALIGLAAKNRHDKEGDDRTEHKPARKTVTQSPSDKAREAKDQDGGVDRSSSKSGSRGRSKKNDTGAEVIQPVASPDARLGESKPMFIETLSGYGSAKDWALGLKTDVADYLAGDLAWSDMSTRLLLSGPPGTGKTMFARALCNSLQMPLVVSSVSTWLQGDYLSNVLDRMADTFAEARALAPCILFVDEIDGIGSRVSATRPYADYWNTCVNKLLELLDGAVKSEGVIVVGATNRPGEIDEAIRRSGRLETHIEIPRPDISALTGILAHHLGSDLDNVAADTTERSAS
jgi:hypothetical protein